MDFLNTFNNLSLSIIPLSEQTRLAVKRQRVLRDQFHECNDPTELAVIYELFLQLGGNIRCLELDKRDKNLLKQMGEIYRQNINYTGYDSV
jgi:hypothetical protein